MRLFLALLFMILISSCHTYWEAQEEDAYRYSSEMPEEPGKCFARVLIQDHYETEVDSVYRYTGENYDQSGVEEIEIVVRPASTKWEKKINNKRCLSADPDDCLVWCLQETPAVLEYEYIVTDTALVKDFKFDYTYEKKLIKPGGFTEWREVACETDPGYDDLLRSVHITLHSLGYDMPPFEKDLTPKAKAALIKFQKDNRLPIGQMDTETLDALGVSY